ncbi:MAG: alpha/beta fold hydrolase [Candidatus Obscuribacterales bacterium]|nr:alpha/beta fold hydrolase [Candidatus Obscuribacterales bacterium]
MPSRKLLTLILSAYFAISPAYALSEKQVDSDLAMMIEEKDILQKIQAEKIEEARRVLPLRLKQANKTGKENVAALQLLALLDFRDHKYSSAAAYLRRAERELERSSKDAPLRLARNNYRQADCYFHQHHYDKAMKKYKSALNYADKGNASAVLKMELLESVSGCLIDQGKYEEALPYCKTLVEIAEKESGNINPAYACTYMWALLRLGRAYLETGESKKGEACKNEAHQLMDKLLNLRSELAANKSLSQDFDIYVGMMLDYLKAVRSESSTDWLWLITQVRFKTLPVIAWGQFIENPKAVIICIHGLGLDNRAFTLFGTEMAERNFAVYALDVRGFGSWHAEKGYEKTAYSNTIKDIMALSEWLHKKYPKQHIYLLGESMGGAIALKTVAEEPKTADGVISSVPSASLAAPVKLSLKVAFHALEGFDKPFNIGDTIGPMATNSSKLLAAWEIDPNSRQRMSPKELMKYGLFLKACKHASKSIESTPVLMTQGLSDRLMSPQGSVAIFESIPNKDKTFMAIGDAQHLMFETDKQNPLLLDSLDSWIENHNKTAAKK